jgi:hypothetical protein
MLAAFRPVARPLAALLLALFLAPGAVAQCREISAVTGDAMACCKRGDGAGLTAECCAVQEAPPASERPSSATAAARSSHALAPAPALPPLGLPALVSIHTLTAATHLWPPDPLYLLYLSIRR